MGEHRVHHGGLDEMRPEGNHGPSLRSVKFFLPCVICGNEKIILMSCITDKQVGHTFNVPCERGKEGRF